MVKCRLRDPFYFLIHKVKRKEKMAPKYKEEDRVELTRTEFSGKTGTIKRIEDGKTQLYDYFVLLDDCNKLVKITARNFKKKELEMTDYFNRIPDEWETSSSTSRSDSETSIQAYSDSEEETEYYDAEDMEIDSEVNRVLKRKFEEMNTKEGRVPKKVKTDELEDL